MSRKLLPLAAALALAAAAAPAPRTATAVFAGGCFWSTETDLQRVPGIIATQVGYAGGHVPKPSYEQVSAGDTGHREAVRVTYDPARISYPRLLDAYLHTIDPADGGGTFCDRGDEYRDAVFAGTPAERAAADAALKALARQPHFAGGVKTQVLRAAPFYPAEGYHQNYHAKNPIQYGAYRMGCGRDRGLRAVWGTSPADGKAPFDAKRG